MNTENLSLLLEMALDFSISVDKEDGANRIVSAIRKVISCDAVAILKYNDGSLIPLAVQGLALDTLGRRFHVSEHPRFEVLCRHKNAYCFEDECDLPDPYDGLLLSMSGDLPVHSCLGIPLRKEDELIGLITVDSLSPGAFVDISPKTLDVISALGASALANNQSLRELKERAKHARQLVQELNEEALSKDGGEIIGQSIAMEQLRQHIALVAGSDFTVLVEGETGVGKELVARTLHKQSPRHDQPLVHVNCAALTESLAESELFGHAKGAFTGADKKREGKFLLADKGTLFLDEIGELPLVIQSKLLRAIQSGEIQPVGEDKVSYVDVRLVVATNRNLKEEVEKGRFRADLYHRLSVYPLKVPPLAQRDSDAILLAGYFLEKTRKKLGLRQLKLSAEAITAIGQYEWPGNVRELEHTISRASLKAMSEQSDKPVISLSSEHLSLNANSTNAIQSEVTQGNNLPSLMVVSALSSDKSLRSLTENFQVSVIAKTLETCDGNWAKAAKRLNHDRGNLMRLAKRLGLRIDKKVNVSIAPKTKD